MGFQKIRISLKELGNKSLESYKVHIRVWVKELEIDLNMALLNKIQETIK